RWSRIPVPRPGCVVHVVRFEIFNLRSCRPRPFWQILVKFYRGISEARPTATLKPCRQEDEEMKDLRTPTNGLPPKQGLYDPWFEHDACGVGFVVNVKGKKSHQIIQQALQV